MTMTESAPLRIDIVSDVVCPWCIIGYRQLRRAMEATGVEAYIHWHPFELNPKMGPEGQDLREHVAEKYGSTAEDSRKVRDHLASLGEDLGFAFNWQDDGRIYNTFGAHQLIHWANQMGQGLAMKNALFRAYFTDGQDVSDGSVLCQAAESAGLDPAEAATVLQDQRFAGIVREKEKFWIDRGVRGVPAMIFQGRHAVTGAQGAENYAHILEHFAAEPAQG
jgi:predicted DsbA family dithiol-disulfide isomerase